MFCENLPFLLRPPLREGTEDGGGKPMVFTPPPTPLRETGTELGRNRDGGRSYQGIQQKPHTTQRLIPGPQPEIRNPGAAHD